MDLKTVITWCEAPAIKRTAGFGTGAFDRFGRGNPVVGVDNEILPANISIQSYWNASRHRKDDVQGDIDWAINYSLGLPLN